MSPVCGAKGVVDIHISQLRKFLCESHIPFRLLRMKPEILKQKNLSGLQITRTLSCALTNGVIRKVNGNLPAILNWFD